MTEDTVLSRNEAEALALKAARGAGLPWGVAEEAAMAVGVLQGWGIDGLSPLAAHLDEIEKRGGSAVLLTRGQEGLVAGDPSSALSPLALGPALMDFSSLVPSTDGGPPWRRVAWPVLLLPFLSSIAAGRRQTLHVMVGLQTVVLTEDGRCEGPAALACLPEAEITIRPAMPKAPRPTAPALPPPVIPQAVLVRLDALAMKTTVPASAQSRADAGSGMSDND